MSSQRIPFRRGTVKKTILSGCGGLSPTSTPRNCPQSTPISRSPSPRSRPPSLPFRRPTRSMRFCSWTAGSSPASKISTATTHSTGSSAGDSRTNSTFPDGRRQHRGDHLRDGQKCLVAGIPVLVSTGTPTALAVEIADETGLCIVGSARTPEMAVYTHPERIVGVAGVGWKPFEILRIFPL